MDSKTKKLIERYENDFDKLSANENYTKEQLTQMKDLQKLMYYIEVRCAMKDGEGYPGSDYMPGGNDRSYARHRNAMGQYTSGHYPMMEHNGGWYYDSNMNMGSGNRYYDGNSMSGRRYYDSEKEKALHYLHKMMDNENSPDVISDIQNVIRVMEMK